jgi:hypothetical protein
MPVILKSAFEGIMDTLSTLGILITLGIGTMGIRIMAIEVMAIEIMVIETHSEIMAMAIIIHTGVIVEG